MRPLAAIDDETEAFIDQVYRLRHESLQTIDRHVEAFVQQLERLGVLDHTYVIYTSDNGFQLGQHRLKWDKRHMYEHDIRVPLIMRGPGVLENAVIDQLVSTIDIAPTIVDIVTAQSSVKQPAEQMDGQSILPLFQNAHAPWRTDLLVSYHGEGDPACGLWSCPPPSDWSHWHGGTVPDSQNNTYSCLRTVGGVLNNAPLSNSMYCQFHDDESFVEFYNLTADPWQLRNGIDELGMGDRFALEARLAHLKACRGSDCRAVIQ